MDKNCHKIILLPYFCFLSQTLLLFPCSVTASSQYSADLHYSLSACSCSGVLQLSPQHCAALCCSTPYRTVLHCTVVHYTVLFCSALYSIVLHCTAVHCTTLCCTVLLFCIIHALWQHSGWSVRLTLWGPGFDSWSFLRKGGIQESACQMNALPWHGFL